MVLGFLAVRLQKQHGKATGGIQHWGATAPGGEPRTYKMYFLTAGGPRNCPVKGFRGRSTTRTSMWVHFLHQHVQYTLTMLLEGNFPHPWFPRCITLVLWWALNRRHITTSKCAKGVERNIHWMTEEDLWECAQRAFQAYERLLETFTSFKYLGRVLTAVDRNWRAVVGNLRNTRTI